LKVNEFSYVEPFINEDGAEAIRFYETSGILTSDDFFVECSDSSGVPFGPSGSPDMPATAAPSPYIETALPFTGTQEPEPVVVNRETGLQVQFETGTWDAQTDLFFTTLECTLNVFDDASNAYTSLFNGGGVTQYSYLPRITGFSPDGGGMNVLFEGRAFIGETWSVSGNDFNNSLFASSQWYEPVTNFANSQGVRYWGNPGNSETERSSRFADCYAFDGTGGFEDTFRPRQNTDTNDQDTDSATDVDELTIDENSASTNSEDSEAVTDTIISENNSAQTTPVEQPGEDSGGGALQIHLLLCILAMVFFTHTRRSHYLV